MIRLHAVFSILCCLAVLAVTAHGQPATDKESPPKKPDPKKIDAKADDKKKTEPKVEDLKTEPKKIDKKKDPKKTDPKAEEKKNDGSLPHTKLMPAKRTPDLSPLTYRVSTSSPECQEFFDQGLAYYYGYVWMEAARSFETAAKHDPNCALAWWGLSKACDKWGKAPQEPPLKKAQEMLPFANEREKRLIKARLQEKGLLDGIKTENRRKEAVKTLDELLALFDDDEEGWFARAQVAEGPLAVIPFYKALLRINPRHPGAHHELIHQYEDMRRPALGWPHAEGFLDGAPGVPHANHMQAHLAMRIGKWEKTTDRSARAIELEEVYLRLMNVKPSEDHQLSHHYQTLLRALIHDGRFKEALEVRKKCEAQKLNHKDLWFRLALAQRDWDEAMKLAGNNPKDKSMTSYLTALVYLKKGDNEAAAEHVKALQAPEGKGKPSEEKAKQPEGAGKQTDEKGKPSEEKGKPPEGAGKQTEAKGKPPVGKGKPPEAGGKKGANKEAELRISLTQGLLECGTGDADLGLKLLAKVVDKTKNDYAQHAWGHGAYYMEYWGLGALRANRLDVAEEAFLEALAHDAGSVGGALGMQVVCERQGRAEEAKRFASLAERCWRKADPGALQAELQYLRGQTVHVDQEKPK
jgi:tetratricopeptide (TPR) repeat protein